MALCFQFQMAQKMHFNCISYVLNSLLIPLSILEKERSTDGEEKKTPNNEASLWTQWQYVVSGFDLF